MDRKGFWFLGGAILLVALILVISNASAQRDLRGEHPADSAVGRYQLVQVTDTEIIIMDTTNGDLYTASAKDIKPYNMRPQMGRRSGFSTTTKDRVTYDKMDRQVTTDKDKVMERREFKDKK